MKKTILVSSMLFALAMSATIQAQDTEKKESEEGFVFTTVKENPITSVKNQNRAGTCWCYSSYSFLESELLRMGKGEYDLSEMFTVYNTYLDRADAAVRTHGDVSFSQGGSFYDRLDTAFGHIVSMMRFMEWKHSAWFRKRRCARA